MVYLVWILVWFEALSGLKINLEKSCILLMGGSGELGSVGPRAWVQYWGLTHNLFNATSWGETQLSNYLGWGGRKILEKTIQF